MRDRDLAMSRGAAGVFAYDFEPMRHEAEKHLGCTVHFWCPINAICIAGFVSDGGPIVDLTIGLGGFLTKPWRLQ